jgi:Predicted nucleic-acid-binding protein implicated in transcription termination
MGLGHIRTCVGCGVRGSRKDLLRLVLGAPDSVAVDVRATMPGRGAWVHPQGGCIRNVLASPGRLIRTLRAGQVLDLGALITWNAEQEIWTNIESGLEADGHPMSTQR